MKRTNGKRNIGKRSIPKGWRPIVVNDVSYAWKVSTVYNDDLCSEEIFVMMLKPGIPGYHRVNVGQAWHGMVTPSDVEAMIRILSRFGWKPDNERKRRFLVGDLDTPRARSIRLLTEVEELMSS